MNPLTPTGNTSQEAARAKELADLVHKTKLGAHTDHAKDAASAHKEIKTFDTQQGGHTLAGTTAAPALSPAALAAKRVLQQTQLVQEEKPATLPRLSQPAPMGAITYTEKATEPVARIHQNESLTNQSAVLHTLSQDVESLVKDRRVSMVRAVALESDADRVSMPRMAEVATRRGEPSRSLLPILSLLCLVFAVGIIGTTWYIVYTRGQEEPRALARYDSGLIFYEHTQPFDATSLERYELLGGLAHVRDTVPSSLGSCTVVDMFSTAFDKTTERRASSPLPLLEFFARAELAAPEQLTRALTGEYMVVIHQGDTPRPVVLLRTKEPDAAFAGMLAWEKQLPQRLSPFFPLGTLVLANAQPQFKDVSFNNIDARVLYDGSSGVVVMYALLEGNVIAITNSEGSMNEVASRLHTQRLKN